MSDFGNFKGKFLSQKNHVSNSICTGISTLIKLVKQLFSVLLRQTNQFFGDVSFEKGRGILRWKDSSADLKVPTDADAPWIEEEISNQEFVLAKLHSLEKPDKEIV